MHPDAAYWALIGESDPALGTILGAWRRQGSRSPRDLFTAAPHDLAALLDLPEPALAPLLAARARLPQAHRLIERLDHDDVDLLTWRDRQYPAALKGALGLAAPRVLWYLGPLDLLRHQPVAVLGDRSSPPAALTMARALAGGIARAGHPVLTGTAGAVERAALDAALAREGGSAVVVLAQGIMRALPELRRLIPAVRKGRLLVIGHLAPTTPWQPGLDGERSALLAGLAERIVAVHLAEASGPREAIRMALRAGRPVYLAANAAEQDQTLSGVMLLADWQNDVAGSLARILEPASTRPPTRSNALRNVDPAEPLEDALFRYLRGARRGATGKGALLQAFAVEEGLLDRALAALIAGGLVVERSSRAGAAYSALGPDDDAAQERPFQPSLFGDGL